MVAPYWGMPCGRESRADCNSVWLADDIKTKIIKCSSRSVLANTGYGTILYITFFQYYVNIHLPDISQGACTICLFNRL